MSLKDQFTEKQYLKIEMTFDSFKSLIPVYQKYVLKGQETEFSQLNRNPLWDITNCKYFKTGLKSDGLKKNENVEMVDDHFFQRSHATKVIFRLLVKNPGMTIDQFISYIKTLSSTVILTKEEHTKVTVHVRKKKVPNYVAYKELGINVEGLQESYLSDIYELIL